MSLRNKIKGMVGVHNIEKIRDVKTNIDIAVSRLAVNFRFTSVLYYAFYSRAFGRECKAVLEGKIGYFKNIKNKSPEYLLRRNIHRIEKGLTMQPRKPIFALDYIGETVDAYCSYSELQPSCTEKDYKWYSDVLSEYFDTVEKNTYLQKNQQKFKAFSMEGSEECVSVATVKSVPFKRDLSEVPVAYENMLQLAKRRRSVRWFLDKEVARENIDKAVAVANLSPSACNRQPFEFRVFDDRQLVQKIAATSIGTTGFISNIPVIAVVIGKLDAYFSERDRHVIYIDGSLASMSFMFALETLGLSSCPINWPDIEKNEKALANILGLKPFERPIMLIALGHPDSEALVPFSEKKSLDKVRSYNKVK
jgi:nitroreductase